MRRYKFLWVLLLHLLELIPLSLTYSPIHSNSENVNRRQALQISPLVVVVAASTTWMTTPSNARAIGEGDERMVFRQKPTAPIGALLPAIQQRLLLEAALDLAKKQDFSKLRSILAPLEEDNGMYNDNKNGRQNARILKQYNPAKVLRGDVVRASMNLYQTNLNYNTLFDNPDQAFTITDPDWKKSYIRAQGGLPDIRRVVGADLDVRTLLRNQVQLQIDEAAAELYAVDGDPVELLRSLQDAARNFDLWLDRIRAGDVRDALQMALVGQSIPVYDSYAAGFVPPPQ